MCQSTINSENEFIRLAISCYDNPIITSVSEFESDIRRISTAKIALRKYIVDNDKTRLHSIVNHFVIIGNCFGVKNAVEMIRYKIDEEDLSLVIESIFNYLKFDDKQTVNETIMNELRNL
jgi:hypothetical protein